MENFYYLWYNFDKLIISEEHMRIGIDIDDTLTDIKDKLTMAAKKYAISLNKKVENKEYQVVDIYNYTI